MHKIDISDRQSQRFKVISLDVWGHGPEEHEKYGCEPDAHGEYRCDGYTVNDAHYTSYTVEVSAAKVYYNQGTAFASSEYHTEAGEIIKACVEAGMLTPDCNADTVEVDGEDEHTLFLNRKEDGKPLIQLERIY
jgi:hypothetical protein